MALDSERLTTRSPLLEGGGLISIERAAEAIGLSGSSLMGELLNVKAKIVTNASNWSGWVVRDIDAIERDFDGAFVLNHVEEQGERQVLIGFARPFDSLAAISALMTDGVATVEILRLRGKSAVFLDEPTSVPLAAWMVQKGIIDSIRARLADVVTQTQAGLRIAVFLGREGALSAAPEALAASHHLNLAHGLAVPVIRENARAVREMVDNLRKPRTA